MRHSSICAGLSASCGLLLAGNVALADGGIRFSDFTPLAASAGPTADEATPITFGNPAFAQRSIADRAAQLAAGVPNSGDWDMNTINENGKQKEGRFLFYRVRDRASGRAAPRSEDGDDGDHLARPRGR